MRVMITRLFKKPPRANGEYLYKDKKLPNLGIVYFDGPKGFTELYKQAGRSCMICATNSSLKGGLWSTAFYGYVPGLRGIGIRYDGRYIGRTIVFNNKTRVAPIYSSEDGKYSDCDEFKQCQKILGKAGIKYGEFVKQDFEIPFIKHFRSYYLLRPYFDIAFGHVLITLNLKAKVAKYSFASNGKNRTYQQLIDIGVISMYNFAKINLEKAKETL